MLYGNARGVPQGSAMRIRRELTSLLDFSEKPRPMTTFSWLHLTDRHHGASKGWKWPSIKDEFFQDLVRLHKICGPWDLILFTGDLTNRADFGKLDEEIEEIREKVAELSNGEKPILLAVPGNHDLEKPDQDNPLIEKLQQWGESDKVRSDFWEKGFYRHVVEESFQNYQDWWEPYFNALGNDYQSGVVRVKDKPKKGLLPGDFSVTIEKGECRLGIIGLNTSFLHMLPDRKPGQVALHTDQFAKVCGGDGPKWARDHHACLLMTHHPPEWLDKESKEEHLLAEIQPQNLFAAHLCGHVHKASYEPLRRLFRACSLFGLKLTENGDDRRHGYAAGRIDLHGTKGKLDFWPRAAKKEEHVMCLQEDDSDNFFLNAKGKYTQPLEFDLSKPCTGKDQIREIPEPGSPYSPDFCVRRTSLVGRALVQLRKGGSKPHEPPVFWGPRGFGKRWLVQDTLHELNRENQYEIVHIDIDAALVKYANSSLSEFFRWVAGRIVQNSEIVGNYFEEYASPIQAITALMKLHLEKITVPFVLVIENADRIVSYSFGEELFKLLRTWINDAGREPDPWVKFLLIMSVETNVSYLSDRLLYDSPFNIAYPIPVEPFTDDEILELADIFGISLTEDDRRSIKEQFGNQPLVTTTALHHANKEGKDWKRIAEESDKLQGYIEHLAHELRAIGREQFRGFMKVQTGLAKRWDRETHEPLERLGLVVNRQEVPELSCELYRSIL
uniref:Calcineurin-like phosphoesterase n=1 Tax=Candidatus Kentrum sp. DK TaxID=2126562 RepID=A0A450RTN7_9GAMM|nr:MAG: Calcineurin-like phosphoesterase [Candidatus Kentron sp. DK]VFJ48111.1 MAG: Calcineurin-like phosphoesterase [Candidatus Kentron sp. DK]